MPLFHKWKILYFNQIDYKQNKEPFSIKNVFEENVFISQMENTFPIKWNEHYELIFIKRQKHLSSLQDLSWIMLL